MSTSNTSDIDELIKELEHYQLNMNDRSLGTGFWDRAVKDFISRHSGHIVRLLEELAKTRGKIVVNLPASNLHQVILEGVGRTPAKALSAALNKTILYLSNLHDIILILREFSETPEGDYRAKMEIHTSPPGSAESLIPDEDKDRKKIHDHDYGKKGVASSVRYPLFNHFVGADDDGQDELPEYLLANVEGAGLMNFMIAKDLFNSALAESFASGSLPTRMIIRVRRHKMELAS